MFFNIINIADFSKDFCYIATYGNFGHIKLLAISLCVKYSPETLFQITFKQLGFHLTAAKTFQWTLL